VIIIKITNLRLTAPLLLTAEYRRAL